MQHGIKYSRFIKLLKDKNIELDRKVLATLAVEAPEAFDRVVAEVK
jgi:large subunit ribosomal protein L20